MATTSNVNLRDVIAADIPIFYEQQVDPEAIHMAAFQPREKDAFMAHWQKILGDESVIKKAILFNGQVVGTIVSFNQDGRHEVGYWLDHDYWGKGIATQALRAFLAYAQGRPLYAHVAEHNIASRRVLEKCGFTVCGTNTRNFATPNGEVTEIILKLDV